jgi:hypothetical protein
MWRHATSSVFCPASIRVSTSFVKNFLQSTDLPQAQMASQPSILSQYEASLKQLTDHSIENNRTANAEGLE